MQFEQETSSLKALEPGNQASRSSFLLAAWLRAPVMNDSSNWLAALSALTIAGDVFVVSLEQVL